MGSIKYKSFFSNTAHTEFTERHGEKLLKTYVDLRVLSVRSASPC
jgi:hypothetical protein